MFSVVQIMDDGTYGPEVAYEANRQDALDIQRTKDEDEGIRTDVMELKDLKDVYGVAVEGKAWIVISEMELKEVA